MKRLQKQKVDKEKQAKVLAEAQRNRTQRSQGYREQALKLLPHVCGRCGREFGELGLSELTVHHVDNNHHNNPADGSNWELLCRLCHDREHHSKEVLEAEASSPISRSADSGLGFQAFAGLKDLLPAVEEKPEEPAD